MYRSLLSFACLPCLALAFFLTCTSRAQPPVGLDALEQFADWPLYRQAILARQISSADPQGGDEDGSAYLYRVDSLHVIFDQEGPGCVYRIWVRNTPQATANTLKFYFDGETTPSINVSVSQLFSGFYYPFMLPLVDDGDVSSGGNYCYLPLPFAEHLKIAFVNRVEPHQIFYHVYPHGTQITTYTGLEDPSNVVAQWQNTGTDPKDPAGNISESGALNLQPSQTQTFFSRSGGGSITGLRFTPDPATLSMLASLRLQFYWDDSLIPQVDCSFGSFFGTSLGLTDIAGLPVGIAGDEFYCFFPMPFWQNARLDLYNSSLMSAVDVSYDLTYKTDLYPSESGYFYTEQKSFSSSSPNQDIILAELSGHGNLAGMTVTLMSQTDIRYLQGDLRLYLDGQSQPILQGTDFDGDFNAGDYYRSGPFTLPVHGAPVVSTGIEEKVCAYRFFLGDLIPFANHITLRAEHGHRNSVQVEYSSVIYAFCRPEIALVLSDELDVGDDASMTAHNYSSSAWTSQTHYYAYPGSYDDQFFSDEGRTHFGVSSFTAAIDPTNLGVRLVRRRDASIFPQSAVVSVNGDTVGVWWDGYFNYYRRWSDSAFEIPAGYTQGLSQIDVTVDSRQYGEWSEYYYWIYSHVPPRVDTTPPTQVSNLDVQPLEAGSQMQLQWDPAGDENGVWGYRIFRDTSPGVQPIYDYLVGETPLTVFTDQGLSPGSWYYYRVSAVDFAGNEGSASSEASQRTSCNYLFEGEEFGDPLFSTRDTIFVENMIYYGENWSGQQHLFFASNETSDFFTVTFEVTESDTYDVSGYFTEGPNYGILSLAVDEELIGDSTDLYSSHVVRSPMIEFAPVYLAAGEHRFTFVASGKNIASSNYNLGIDNMLLTSHYLLPVSPSSTSQSPYSFHLSQNYPNPFNSATHLQFSLPTRGFATLAVYDLMGRRVTVLSEGWLAAGIHDAVWRANDCGSGIYFLRLQQGERTAIRKLLLLK